MKTTLSFVKFIIPTVIFFTLVGPSFAANMGNGPKGKAVTPTIRENKTCTAREASTKKRMTQLTQLVTTQYRIFDRAAERIKNYYTNTLIPQGKTLSNYAALTEDVTSKKTAVDTEITKAKNSISAFGCTTVNPTTLMNDFRVNMQSVKNALKSYRTSVKNLIVAVRTLAGDDTVTPSVSPSL